MRRMALLEARRWRRILLVLVLLTLILVYNLLEVEDELELQKFILDENQVPTAQRIMQNYSSTTNDNNNERLLVLFTTMEITPGKETLHDNTLRLWAQLRPAVLPVLFVSNMSDKWQEKARGYGWEILPIVHMFGDIPILRHMWLDAMEKYPGVFYGYANADVLFDESLILTLQFFRDTNVVEKNPFIIGRRTNYFLSPHETLHNLKEVRSAMQGPSAKLFIRHAEDYFITTRRGFPWNDIPDFVIGRVGYDNWLVTYALTHYFFVIDATMTLSCLHQSGNDGNFAGFSHKFLFDINRQLAGIDYRYSLGKTDCAKVATAYSKNTQRISKNTNGTNAISLQVRRLTKECIYWFKKKGVEVERIYP